MHLSNFRRLLSLPGFWFCVALVLRMLYLLEQGGTSPLFYQPQLDEKEAVDSALEILNGAISAEPYFKAPMYSWILAAVMGVSGEAWPWVIRTLQHIAGAGIVAMAASLAGRLSPAAWRSVAIGVAGFLATVYAPLIRLESNISLDFWVVFFQSAMLCALSAAAGTVSRRQWRPILVAGVLAAAAWLTRPTITLLLPFLALWVWWACKLQLRSRSTMSPRAPLIAVRLALLFLLPSLLALAAVAVRNAAVSGDARVMPWQGGFNLYHANRPGAHGRYFVQDRYVSDDHANPTRFLSISEYTATLSPEAKLEFARQPDFSAVNSYWFHRTRAAIQGNPAAWVHLMFQKFVYLFTDKEIFNYEEFDLQRQLSPILRFLPGRFGIAFPLALASLAAVSMLSRRRRSVHTLQWMYVLVLGGGIALYYTSGRMRMPLAFPVLALAGYGAASLFYVSRRRQIMAITLIIVGAVIVWGDWWGVRSESMAHVDLARMSNAAWHRGRYEQALELAEQAEKLEPDYPGLPRLKGQAFYSLGRLQEAEVEFEKSVKVLGDDTSRKNLRVVKEELGKRE